MLNVLNNPSQSQISLTVCAFHVLLVTPLLLKAVAATMALIRMEHKECGKFYVLLKMG